MPQANGKLYISGATIIMYGQYFVLFAILFTGWFLRKINFIDDKMNHSINKLIVYFAYPCLIVHNIGSLETTGKVLTAFIIAFVLSFVWFYPLRPCVLAVCQAEKIPAGRIQRPGIGYDNA